MPLFLTRPQPMAAYHWTGDNLAEVTTYIESLGFTAVVQEDQSLMIILGDSGYSYITPLGNWFFNQGTANLSDAEFHQTFSVLPEGSGPLEFTVAFETPSAP